MHTKLNHVIRAHLLMKTIPNAILWTINMTGIPWRSKNLNDHWNVQSYFRYRHICPQESQCVVTIGRIWPKKEPPSNDVQFSNGNYTESDPVLSQMKDYEGKSFVSRSCQPIDRLDYCKKFPSDEDAGFTFDRNQGEIYQCNLCDTESCNSWATTSMPDARYNSAFSYKISALFLALLLTL